MVSHVDAGFGHALLTGARLSLIDHMSMFLWYQYDVACAFWRADSWNVGAGQARWDAYIDCYTRETAVADEWSTELAACLQLRRLAIYLLVARNAAADRGDRDAHRLEQWRRDIVAGEPPVTTIDFG